MPQLAIAPSFLDEFARLDASVRTATLTAMQAFLSDAARVPLERVVDAPDPGVRVLAVHPHWRAVVVPAGDDVYCLVSVRRHDEAATYARDHLFGGDPAMNIVELSPVDVPTAEAPQVIGPKELAVNLAEPFGRWQTALHPDQYPLVEAGFAGSAQITGGPGTGKTGIALHRAAYLAAQDAARSGFDNRTSVLLTTVNRLPAQTLSSQLDRIVTDPDVRARIDVATIDSLARSVVHEHTGLAPETLSKDELSAKWREAAQADGIPYSGRFLADEWEQVILARGFTDLPDYIRCDRFGRVLHLAPEHRTLVWQTIQRFTAAMRTRREWSYPQVAAEAARAMTAAGPQYRHVIVDEAQDLHPTQWRLLRALVTEGPDDLFIAGDPDQRSYDHRVSLASLGVNVRGRSHRLRTSYRISQEILDWAVPILGHAAGSADEHTDDAGASQGYRSLLRGPFPVVYRAAKREEELASLARQVRAWLAAGVEASSIAVAGRNHWVIRHVAKELVAGGIATTPIDTTDPVEAVRLGTMHKMKGQEFRCVAVVGVSEPLLPPKAAIDAAEGDPVALEQVYQQERNLLFTACTRARDALHVSYVGTPSRLLPAQTHTVG